MRKLEISIKWLHTSFLKMCSLACSGAIFCMPPPPPKRSLCLVFFYLKCFLQDLVWLTVGVGPTLKTAYCLASLLWIPDAVKVRKTLSGQGHNKRPYWMLFSWACKFSEVYCSDLESTDYAVWFKTLKEQSVWAAVKFLQNKQTHKLVLYNLLILLHFPWLFHSRIMVAKWCKVQTNFQDLKSQDSHLDNA